MGSYGCCSCRADEVNVQVGGDLLVDLGEELLEFGGAVPVGAGWR